MSIRKVVSIEQADWQIAPPPEWVQWREPDWDFAPPPGHAVAFLLIDEQHHVATQAVAIRSLRRAETHAAVQALGQVELEFDPAAQRLRIHEMAVWRRNAEGAFEKRSLADREHFLIRQREQQLEQQMLNGRASVVALIEDLRVGDVIDLAWTLDPRDPLPGLRFTAFHAFVWTVPVARAFFTLHRDDAQPAQWRLHAPQDAVMPREEATPERVTWASENPPLAIPEPNAPGWHWPFPVLDVSGWSNWGEVAEFVAALWADALADAQAAVSAEAARLRVAGDAAATLRAAIRFVQEQVRYLAVDFGHGAGMLPNGSGTVLRRRFGDCKDKSVLLTALLRALGFEAWPLLVGAGWQKAVARVQPSTAAFSHAIVTFLAEGRRHFVDPTFLGQGGDLEHLLPPPYGCGLEVRAGVTSLTLLPARPLAEITLTETFHLDRSQREGAVEQVLRATAWLADDVRATLVRGGQAAFFKARAEALQKHFPALAAREESAQVRDDLAANAIELHANHGLPTWGPAADNPPAMFRYGAHGLFLGIEMLEGPEQRRQPWLLRHPLRVHHRVVVRGKCVRKTKPERHRVSGPGFRYECDVASRRREIVFDYRWETTQGEVAPEEWPQYCHERARAFERAGANVATPAFWSMDKRNWIMLGVTCVFMAIGFGSAIRQDGEPARATLRGQADAETAMQNAVEALRRGDYATAEPLVEQVRPYYAKGAEYQAMRADVAINTGHFDRAKSALAAARKLQPSSVVPDLLEAQLKERTGDLPGARELLERALKQAPENGAGLFAFARVAEQLGDTAAAARALEKFLALFPANPDALKSYALLLWRSGERDRADAAITSAIRAQPTASAALEAALSDYFSATGRHAEAVAPAQRAAEMAPSDPRAGHRHAMARARAGDRAGALEVARRLTEQFPEQPLAWSALAAISSSSGDYATASNAFRKCIKLAPRDATAFASYGLMLHRSGRTGEARAILEKAARDFPGDGLVWLNYAVVLEAIGEREPAAEARKKSDALLPAEQRATMLR
jgi:tetratricopeptide (TPR) repeat protein